MAWTRKNIISYLSSSMIVFSDMFKLLLGTWYIYRLSRPPITIFGGAQLKPESPYHKQAAELGKLCALNHLPILTGGGPGIMEASTCGAAQVAGKVDAMAIRIKGLTNEVVKSNCASAVVNLDYFFARKWLLIQYSVGFVVFPGGFGTFDELTDILNLVRTKKIKPSPIILIGKDFWHPFVEWLNNSAIPAGAIQKEEITIFTITDSVEEAVNVLKKHDPNEPIG